MSSGEQLARDHLVTLFVAAERASAGVRLRQAVLTAKKLEPYRSTRSLSDKDAFENVMLAASTIGAVNLEWDSGYVPRGSNREGFIIRVTSDDLNALARFLGKTLAADKVSIASKRLSPLLDQYSVLHDVIVRWGQLKTARGIKPEQVDDWIDAARVLGYVHSTKVDGTISYPIREASAVLFKDSKRIENLAATVDVLLSGDLDAQPRSPDEVWKEIGLFREELPVRLAGNVVVCRSRVTSVLDAPYAALPANSILGLETTPKKVISIENQTTFHSEARRLCDENILLLYTNGMPSPAWRAMYKRLLSGLPKDTPVYHWGDIDEGGFRIAWILSRDAAAAGIQLQPWHMAPNEVRKDLHRPASDGTVERMHKYAMKTGWHELAETILEARITIEQESFGG